MTNVFHLLLLHKPVFFSSWTGVHWNTYIERMEEEMKKEYKAVHILYKLQFKIVK
jgi:hypothetical protein